MSAPEIAQLEMLAQVDDLVDRLTQWVEEDSAWEPLNRSRALVRRVLGRLEQLRVRLEAPLVVATFGGTGTGKSSLVNALVGAECTVSGRQRPTTTKPVLILHPKTELEALRLPAEEFEIVSVDAPLLRDIVIVDCPDPDTTETETAGSNLQRLHQLLPHCDVLIYTSTQQKYRSAKVLEELGQAATGCRLLFVQTHADLDDDIREDWRRHLSEAYEVPEMFFVDSRRALQEQLAGRRPTGDLARLQDLLTSELAASQRVQIRRANLLDLIHAALASCRDQLYRQRPALEQLQTELDGQHRRLTETMAEQLRSELLLNRNLWERRLLQAVTEIWGFSPFSSMLRLYHGIGNLVASFGLLRARNSAQMALIGVLQGSRWLQARREEQEAEDRLENVSSFGLDDSLLRESQLVMEGYVRTAKLDPAVLQTESLEQLRRRAANVEREFLGDARHRIDEIISRLAQRNSRVWVRAWYELLFGVYVLFVLARIGKNFFYDTFLRQWLTAPPTEPVVLLTVDFYIAAAVFFVLWTGVLVMAFARRLRRGLDRHVTSLAEELVQHRMASGLFPELEATCRNLQRRIERLESMLETTQELRRQLAMTSPLGAPTTPATAAVSV